MTLTITLATAAAAAVLNIWLMIRVGAVRQSEQVSVGDGGNENVIRRMRAHANFIESAPFVLILIAAIELARHGGAWLHYIAAIYIIGRIAHAFGMDGGAMKLGRMIGTVLTMLILLGLGVYAALIASRVVV